jgi:hypothetical protein
LFVNSKDENTTTFNVPAIFSQKKTSKRTHFWKDLSNSTLHLSFSELNQVENIEIDRIPQGNKLTGGSQKHNRGSSTKDRK